MKNRADIRFGLWQATFWPPEACRQRQLATGQLLTVMFDGSVCGYEASYDEWLERILWEEYSSLAKFDIFYGYSAL